MTHQNGSFPDYLLIYSPETGWYLTDRHGALLLETVTNPDTLVRLMGEAGKSYQIIDPNRQQKKGTPQ